MALITDGFGSLIESTEGSGHIFRGVCRHNRELAGLHTLITGEKTSWQQIKLRSRPFL